VSPTTKGTRGSFRFPNCGCRKILSKTSKRSSKIVFFLGKKKEEPAFAEDGSPDENKLKSTGQGKGSL
jgi:hypothetical protein